MKAIVKKERVYGATEIMEVPKPEVKPGYILIKIKASAVCGSDLHAYEYPPGYEFMNIPVTLGHEYSGTVEAVGEGVTNFKVGERVMGESNQFCGYCENCHKGLTQICMNNKMTGIHIDGGMAEYISVPERIVHRIPDKVSFEEAAVAQPCAVSFHGVFDNSIIKPADVVVVFGPGIVGLMAAQGAKIMGARKVIVVGTDADEAVRMPVAKELGFDVINGQKQDLKKALKELTGSETVDVVVEGSGAAAAAEQAATIVKKGGGITFVGIFSKPITLPLTNLIRSEVTMHTSYTCNWNNYEQALHLIESGQVNLKPLLNFYKFDDALQSFQDAIDKKVLKPVLQL